MSYIVEHNLDNKQETKPEKKLFYWERFSVSCKFLLNKSSKHKFSAKLFDPKDPCQAEVWYKVNLPNDEF